MRTVSCTHAHDERSCSVVLQADADERQPQRLSSREWAAQDHALFHATRSVRQPWDPGAYLIVRTANETQTPASVPCLTKKKVWGCSIILSDFLFFFSRCMRV